MESQPEDNASFYWYPNSAKHKTMDYKALCEEIYRSWRKDPRSLSEFADDFEIEHLPEPYYPTRLGDTRLVVVNNNPGCVRDFQHHTHVTKTFSNEVSYEVISRWLMEQYDPKTSEINANAKSRIAKMIGIADVMGCEGVENVEMFFLHSKQFNKTRFLKNYAGKELVKTYQTSLLDYLADNKVLIVTAVGTTMRLDIETLSQSPWVREQARIASLDLEKAEIRYPTRKNDRPTSAVVRAGDKVLICCMGTNNIPVAAAEMLEAWIA